MGDGLIRLFRTVLPFQESPVFRSAYSTQTVHRTFCSETLDLQAAPSMRGRHLPQRGSLGEDTVIAGLQKIGVIFLLSMRGAGGGWNPRRDLQERPHQSASQTASP